MNIQERLRSSLSSRYAIHGEIGRGGMASVFLAEDLKHQRKVAVKVLNPDLSEALGAKRFLREIRTVAGLRHPHILPLHDSGEADGLLFYIMPFVEGESLRARLDREQRFSVQEALRITQEVARALAHAHQEGFVHRDVKPANILLESGQAVLADFGLSQALADADHTDQRLTQTGISVGTPAYMSPEQALGAEHLDGRSDQYSLACVLYEMLAGEPAFTGSSPQAILARKLQEGPLPFSLVRSTVSRPLQEVIRKALEKEAADRFPSMEGFSAALEASSERSVRPVRKTDSLLHRKGRWAGGVIAGLAALLVLVVGWGMGWFEGEDPPWGEGYPQSLVILPFTTASSSSEESAAAFQIADLLARELDWWDSLRAMGSAGLTGVIHDLGIEGPTFRRLGGGD